MNQILDLTDALEQIKASAKIDGNDGVLAPLIKHWSCITSRTLISSYNGDK